MAVSEAVAVAWVGLDWAVAEAVTLAEAGSPAAAALAAAVARMGLDWAVAVLAEAVALAAAVVRMG